MKTYTYEELIKELHAQRENKKVNIDYRKAEDTLRRILLSVYEEEDCICLGGTEGIELSIPPKYASFDLMKDGYNKRILNSTTTIEGFYDKKSKNIELVYDFLKESISYLESHKRRNYYEDKFKSHLNMLVAIHRA